MKKKAERRKVHRAINSLSAEEVAGIVRRSFGARKDLDALAKAVIAKAHRQVSHAKCNADKTDRA